MTEPSPPESPNFRLLTSPERWCHLWRHIWSSRRAQVLGTSAALILLSAAVVWFPSLHLPTQVLPAAEDWLDWQENLQTLFNLATLLVAALVWYNEIQEEWTEDLPRLLTVFCYHEGQPVLICYHAYLAGESDIRAWSQQIAGRQMAGSDLSFRPVVDSRPIDTLTDGHAVFLHHQVRFTLTELPKRLADTARSMGHPICLVWHPHREVKPPHIDAAIPAAEAAQLPGAESWPLT